MNSTTARRLVELECQELVLLPDKYRRSFAHVGVDDVEIEVLNSFVVGHPVPIHQHLDALADRVRYEGLGSSAVRETNNRVVEPVSCQRFRVLFLDRQRQGVFLVFFGGHVFVPFFLVLNEFVPPPCA
jgi:hypothetical protein